MYMWIHEFTLKIFRENNKVTLNPKILNKSLDEGNVLVDDVGIAIWKALWRTQTIDNRRSRAYNICIDKLVYAQRSNFMKVGNIII